MSQIQVHDKFFSPYISKETIAGRITELGKEIDRDYDGLNPLFIGVLNSAFIFAADLIRAVTVPSEISFVKLSSYAGTTSTGSVVTAIGLEHINIAGRHVVIVEDIIDTGKTLTNFLPSLQQQQPASLKIAAFMDKPDARKYDVVADYTGFVIPDKFVVGYGLDYDGYGRDLPSVYVLSDQ